ncbi:MAG: SDR family NAD(P)-dependent oxidoreductase [Oscillospiraceae bacterium]
MSRVLITGGTKGIGLAAARKFLDDGDEVIIVSRSGECELASDERVRIIKCDLSDRAAIKCLPTETEKYGNIDILVNNAGVLRGLPFDSYGEEETDRVINLNLIAPVSLAVYFGKKMAENGGGRIVNVASQASVAGNPDIWYGMTKAALVNFTKSMAGHLGKKGVVINAVSPGPVDTEMVSGSPYGERFEKIRRRTYLGRFAKTEEIAQMIYILAKLTPEYYNGENVIINNGALGLEMS